MGKIVTKEDFITRSKKIHGDKYEYCKVEYVDTKTKVNIICEKHGVFAQAPSQHMLGQGCSRCATEKRAKNKMYTDKQFKEELQLRNPNFFDKFELVEKYTGTKNKLLIKDKYGYLSVLPSLLLRGSTPNISSAVDKNEYFIARAREIHADKYDYSEVDYKKIADKVKIYCKTCNKFFMQTTNNHFRGHGCGECLKLTKNEFVERSEAVHGDLYDYSKSVYVGALKKIEIYCTKCESYFWQTASKHMIGRGCPKCNCTERWTLETFVKKAKEIHGEMYDYSMVDFKNIDTKVEIYCKKCQKTFRQSPSKHIYRKQGCFGCFGTKQLTTEEFIAQSYEIHGDCYDYSEVKYINDNTKVDIICKVCGNKFSMKPTNHKWGRQGCPVCNSSRGEKEVAKVLDEYCVNYIREHKFQNCKNKRRLSFDFYLPNHNTCIEYQGRQHYEPIKHFGGEEKFKESQFRDEIKRAYCKEKEINLVEIPYWSFKNIEDILMKELKL